MLPKFSCSCVFLFLCFVQRPKRLYSCNFRVFVYFVPTKRPVLKCFFSSYFVFLLLSSLSKIHFYLLFIHQPLFTEDSLWGFFSLSFAFSFPKVCLFIDTNFPNIPFLKSNLLSLFGCFFLLFLFCFDCVCFSLFCCFIVCWFFCWCFFGFVLCFVFVFFLVLLSVYEKKSCFPCNSGVF